MDGDELSQAIAAIKSGNKSAGGEILARLVKREPDNEQAWWWYSFCAETPEQKNECLEHVKSTKFHVRLSSERLSAPAKKRFINPNIITLAGLGFLGLLFVGIFGFILGKALTSPKADVPVSIISPILPILTLTPVPTSDREPTRAPTLTPRYTRIPARQNNDYNLPPAPKGFTWKVIPDLLMDVLVPDGWFFAQDLQDGLDTFYVSRENVDLATGKLTTGMSVKISRNVKNVDEAAQEFIYNVTYDETTTKVVDSMQINSESNTITVYSLLTEAEFTELDPGDLNREKKMVCNAIADTRKSILYLMVFESPLEIWDEEWNTHGGPVTLSVINLLFAGR
jgi:hypothetical protein